MAQQVHAVIELKITPQRDCGFGKIAERVARFAQVEACFLMSGGYDLLVFARGDSLQDVAAGRCALCRGRAIDARRRALHRHPLHA